MLENYYSDDEKVIRNKGYLNISKSGIENDRKTCVDFKIDPNKISYLNGTK